MEAGKGSSSGKQVVYPKFRKHLYTEFRFCERFGLNPLEFLKSNLSDEDKLLMSVYEGIREHEEYEEKLNGYKMQGYKV